MRRLRVRPRQPGLRGPRETPPGPTMWVRPATGWWGRMNAGEIPRNQGRRRVAPVRSQKAVLRSKEKRRSGALKGAPVRVMDRPSRPQTGSVLPQGRPTGAAFRACEFRRSATLCWRGEGFETDNLARQPAGMRRAATLPHGSNKCAEKNAQRRTEKGMTMPKFAHLTLHRHGRTCSGHPRLPLSPHKAWMPAT